MQPYYQAAQTLGDLSHLISKSISPELTLKVWRIVEGSVLNLAQLSDTEIAQILASQVQAAYKLSLEDSQQVHDYLTQKTKLIRDLSMQG